MCKQFKTKPIENIVEGEIWVIPIEEKIKNIKTKKRNWETNQIVNKNRDFVDQKKRKIHTKKQKLLFFMKEYIKQKCR